MSVRRFSLQPFPTTSARSDLEITGIVTRSSNSLEFRLEVRGPLAEVVIPPPAAAPARTPGLWEETCFECFLTATDFPHYWEFNLSPAGHWNVYRFAAYRQGMEEETAFAVLPFRVKRQVDALLLALEFDLSKIIPQDQALVAAVSAVIKHRNGRLTYWALTHPGPRPDFHRRDSFVIELQIPTVESR
jgi:hypothetical protein